MGCCYLRFFSLVIACTIVGVVLPVGASGDAPTITVRFGRVPDIQQRQCPSNMSQVATIVRTSNDADATVLVRNKFTIRPVDGEPDLLEACRSGEISGSFQLKGLHSLVTGCVPASLQCWNVTSTLAVNITDSGCVVQTYDPTYKCSSTVGVEGGLLTSRKNAGAAFNMTLPAQCMMAGDRSSRATNVTLGPRAVACAPSDLGTDTVSTVSAADIAPCARAGMQCEQLDEAFYCRRVVPAGSTSTVTMTLKGLFGMISGCTAPNGGFACNGPLMGVDYRPNLCKITLQGRVVLGAGTIQSDTSALMTLPTYCYRGRQHNVTKPLRGDDGRHHARLIEQSADDQ